MKVAYKKHLLDEGKVGDVGRIDNNPATLIKKEWQNPICSYSTTYLGGEMLLLRCRGRHLAAFPCDPIPYDFFLPGESG